MTGPAFHRRLRGLSLVELLVALALAALMLAPLAALVSNMAKAAALAADHEALLRDAESALERIASVVRASTAGTLKQGADTTTSGSWFPVTFKLQNGQLVQTNPNGVLADTVAGFSITAPAVTTGQQLVQVSLTLARGGATVSTSMTLRLGGAQ
jgi:prepilin-type N-terminal cleavage/methylation domain-containing protein